jgi:hypothetical protein
MPPFKVEIVAAGAIKFIELLKFQCNQAAVHRPIIMYMSMHDRVINRIKERKCAINFLLKPAAYQICSTYLKRLGHRSRAISSIPYGCIDRDISHTVYRIVARLRTERFLLFLDGVSSYPRAMDDTLIILLGSSKAGSKVIITTIFFL